MLLRYKQAHSWYCAHAPDEARQSEPFPFPFLPTEPEIHLDPRSRTFMQVKLNQLEASRHHYSAFLFDSTKTVKQQRIQSELESPFKSRTDL